MFAFAKKLKAGVMALACMIAAGPAAALTTMSIDSFDAGWYRSDGYHRASNTNIIAGQISSRTYNNFFAFDLSGVSGRVVSATLEIQGGNGSYISNANAATYEVRQVTTSVSSLVGGTGGVAAFNDLGTGTLYGATTVSTPGSSRTTMPSVTIALNNALSDLTDAQGSQIALGGSTNASPYLWGYSNGANAARLTLGIDDTVVLPIPAPLVLLLTALGATAAVARRRA